MNSCYMFMFSFALFIAKVVFSLFMPDFYKLVEKYPTRID